MTANPLGSQLRAIRERRGLTQEQVAARADITRNMYQDIERGRRFHPRDYTMAAIEKALACEVRWEVTVSVVDVVAGSEEAG